MPERKKFSHDRKARGRAKSGVGVDDVRHKLETTKALELRARGWTYKEIANHLKCCLQHVCNLLAMGLKQINEVHDTSVIQYREREWEATQLLLDKYLPEALNGDGQCFERVMRLLERRAKYRGLDVVQHEDRNPIAGSLNLNAETINVGIIPRDQLKKILLDKIAEHQAAQERAGAIEHQPKSESEIESTATITATEEDNGTPNEGID